MSSARAAAERRLYGRINLSTAPRDESFTASATLTSDTNVRIQGGAGYGSDLVSNAVVEWYVVEAA